MRGWEHRRDADWSKLVVAGVWGADLPNIDMPANYPNFPSMNYESAIYFGDVA